MNFLRFIVLLEKAAFMITKKHLKETIEKLPEEVSLEDLIDKLILLDKIERAEKESERGETITEDALDKELEKWFN
jgi:hypothetical protein